MSEKIELHDKSLLVRIFNIQDKAILENLKDADIYRRSLFIDKCFTLMNGVFFKNKINHKEIRFILNDMNTNIACSTRLGLYGCVADAAALSRIALEHLAILCYAIENDKYATLKKGIERGFQKVKIEYDSIKELIDPNISKYHIRLSSLFLHSTKYRVLYGGVHKTGEDCIGASLNKKKILELLGHLCNITLFGVRIMLTYIEKNKIQEENYLKDMTEIENEYKTLWK